LLYYVPTIDFGSPQSIVGTQALVAGHPGMVFGKPTVFVGVPTASPGCPTVIHGKPTTFVGLLSAFLRLSFFSSQPPADAGGSDRRY